MPQTPPQGQPDEAMVDLLIKQVTQGLSSAEQRELDVLDTETASAYLRDFERAAAAVTLAAGTNGHVLPPQLAQRIARQADEHFAALAGGAARGASVARLDDARAARADVGTQPAAGAAPRASRSGMYGWVAAAACLVLAVIGWTHTPTAPELPPVADLPPTTVVPPAPPAPPTPAEERAALLAKSDSVKVTLGVTKDPAARGVSGDVVWDPATQKGFVHFVGLASNDPAVKQYQVWIFDVARDQRYPIDGGVFDVPAEANEVVIPFDASLPVTKAAAFAVTVEKAGGVVVSARQHVVALGATS